MRSESRRCARRVSRVPDGGYTIRRAARSGETTVWWIVYPPNGTIRGRVRSMPDSTGDRHASRRRTARRPIHPPHAVQRSRHPRARSGPPTPRGLRGRLRRRPGGVARRRPGVRRLRPRVLVGRTGGDAVDRSPRGRARRRHGRRCHEARRPRPAQRVGPHRVDRLRPAGLGHRGEPRGEAAAARARVRPRIRPGEAAGRRAQRTFACRDPEAGRAVRGHRPPPQAASRRLVARLGRVLGHRRRLAHGARRPGGAARRVRATVR